MTHYTPLIFPLYKIYKLSNHIIEIFSIINQHLIANCLAHVVAMFTNYYTWYSDVHNLIN